MCQCECYSSLCNYVCVLVRVVFFVTVSLWLKCAVVGGGCSNIDLFLVNQTYTDYIDCLLIINCFNLHDNVKFTDDS